MKKAILKLLKANIKSREELFVLKRKLAKKYGIRILLNSEILKEYKKLAASKSIKRNQALEKILRKRSVRTLSGIAPVAVLTMPYPCPGRCVYCPTEKNVPQSYLSNEPAVMRAIRCNYHPYIQVQSRLQALEVNGHQPEKIELIVIGGTWSVLPVKYKYWFIGQCFQAANEYSGKAKSENLKIKSYSSKLKINKLKAILDLAQVKNEKAKYKIIGITLETRPDYINKNELWQMRELGCTRVELGVQAIDNKILTINRRGHDVECIASATKLLKDFGFKVTYHIMPGLPGSSAAQDVKMYKQLFSDERFQPDQIKFYPTVVTKGSVLYKWWQNGRYQPYRQRSLNTLIRKCKEATPPYVRIIRLIRDIPAESIIAGNTVTNLRQIMQAQGVKCRCIRCREARQAKIKSLKLKIINYKASGGNEYFISFESPDSRILYGFCRLRLPNWEIKKKESDFSMAKEFKCLFGKMALIRELHVYGELVPVGQAKKIQHSGLGRKLMVKAEEIARNAGCQKIAVIAGIGVRGYYRKLGYQLFKTYMLKKLV